MLHILTGIYYTTTSVKLQNRVFCNLVTQMKQTYVLSLVQQSSYFYKNVNKTEIILKSFDYFISNQVIKELEKAV
jgi:hypothetical protein